LVLYAAGEGRTCAARLVRALLTPSVSRFKVNPARRLALGRRLGFQRLGFKSLLRTDQLLLQVTT
jgi:hypothetical protein